MRFDRVARVGALVWVGVASACVFITEDELRTRPGHLLARVLDPTGHPAAGVAVTLDGESIGVTDAAGWVSRESLAEGWHALGASQPRGIPAGGAVQIVPDQTRVAVLRLSRTREGVVHRPSTGGAITRDGRYALVFPDGAFLGAEPQIPVTVSYAWVEPGDGTGPAPVGEGGVPLDLVAVAWIGEATAGGSSYPIDPSKPGTLRIPAPPGDPLQMLAAPEVFRFDEATGLWVGAGPATPEDAYLTGAFEGAGWWAIGSRAGALGCLSGALSAGADAAGTLLTHQPPDRPLATVAWADESGRFCVPAPMGHVGRVDISGASFAGDRRFGLGLDAPAPQRVATCGDGCSDLGHLQVEVHEDADGDGLFAGVGGDCDDRDDAVGPGLVDDAGDGLDQNCDGLDGTDLDHDGVVAGPDLDCDDADPLRAGGLLEVCDDVDNDCDDRPDEGVADSVDDPMGGCLVCGPQATLDLGPKLYLNFGEVTGTTADASGFGFDATVSGLLDTRSTVAHDGVPTPWFGGTRNDYVLVPTFTEMGSDALTVSMFLRPTLSRKTLLSYALAPVGDETALCAAMAFMLKVNPPTPSGIPGYVSLRIRDWSVNLPNADSLDAWEHLVVTWQSNGRVVAYKNLVKVFDGELTTARVSHKCPENLDTTTTPPTTGTPTYDTVQTTLPQGGTVVLGQDQDCLGACLDSAQAFEGAMDEIAIFDRILTENEITALYRSVTCGEGLACDGRDDDGDGIADEHLVGSDSGTCLAGTCQDIVDNEADMGDGLYWVQGLEDDGAPVRTTCSFPEDGDCACTLCGDGIVVDPYESCDGDTAACRECVLVPAVQARTCADILTQDPAAIDGVYWIHPDGSTPYKARCSFGEDGGGWTLVVNQDTRGGTAFYDPIEDPPDEPVVDRHTYYTSTAGLYDWREANRDDPFAGSYSILGQLERFRGGCGFDFRMVFPFDGSQSLAWRQTSNPTIEAVAGYAPIRVPDYPTVPFRGLRRAYGLGEPHEDAYIWSHSTPPNYFATALMMADYEPYQEATWFPVCLFPPGSAFDHDYLLWASPDLSPDATVRGSELWVRPCAE